MENEHWLDPQSWEGATWEEQLGLSDERVAVLPIGDYVRPIDLYAYLRARFGVPNGLPMKHRMPDSSENAIQWAYGLKSEGTLMYFIGSNRATELLVQDEIQDGEEAAQTLADNLKQELPRWASELGEVKDEFENWKMAVNPYYRLNRLVERLERRLEELELNPPDPIDHGARLDEFESYLDSFEDWREASLEAFYLTSSASIFAPILAESFLNLTLFCLAKPPLREDREAFEEVLQSDIHNRVLDLHDYCLGLDEPLQASHPEEVKTLLQRTNRRNTLLHGNVDLRELVFGDVAFDLRTIPLFEDDQPLSVRLVSHLADLSDPEDALQEIRFARSFVEAVLDALSPAHEAFVESIMVDSHIGWRSENQKVGVLFGPMVAEQYILADGTLRNTRLSRRLVGEPPETWELVRHPPREIGEEE